MNKLFANRQAGVGHLGLIVGVVVVLALGAVGYFVYTKNNSGNFSGNLDSAVAKAIREAKCEYDDKNLCKFYAGFGAQQYHTATMTSTDAEGTTTNSTLKWQGDKFYMKIDSADYPWETITLGTATYTRAADGTWWKQTTRPAGDLVTAENYKPELDEPADNAAVESRYKNLGKEACGDLTCFKYQQIYPDSPEAVYYFWFDDRNYQLRRTYESAGGTKTEATYSYDKFDLTEPSPVKELGENQYLLPGQSEPQTMPTFDES